MIIVFVALSVMLMGGLAHGETLQSAMMSAYQTNPILQKEQARLRAVDEGVPLAKSSARPSFDFNATAGQNTVNQNAVQRDFNPRSVGVTLTQPIYKGGRIDAGIDAAEKTVLAQRATLLDAEQSLFMSVAQSYFDVWSAQAVLKLNYKNEEVLRQELQAARDRFKVGEATRTDVSQAESRHSGAIAARIESQGRLANSKATYEKVIGHAPAELLPPDIRFETPQNLEDVIRYAQEHNPKVIAAHYNAQSAEHDVDTAQGALLPEVNIQAGASRDWDRSAATLGAVDSANIAAVLTVPLYRGGADYARTRAAKETASQRRIETRSAMDIARETAVSAWESLKTADATIKARQKQVEAAELAFMGVKEESKVGTRTILDRLNAEAEALQARVNLVQAQRDRAVAMFSVKAAVGDLTAQKVALPVTPYDPAQHYEATKDAWIGLGISDSDKPTDTAPPVEQAAEKALLEPLIEDGDGKRPIIVPIQPKNF